MDIEHAKDILSTTTLMVFACSLGFSIVIMALIMKGTIRKPGKQLSFRKKLGYALVSVFALASMMSILLYIVLGNW